MRLTLFLLCNVFITSFCFAQEKDRVSRVKIYATKEGFGKVKQAGVELDHGSYESKDGILFSHVNEIAFSEVAKIRALGIKVDVLIKDLFAYTDSVNKVEDPYKHDKKRVRLPANMKNLRLNFADGATSQETYVVTPSTFKFGTRGGFLDGPGLLAELDDMVASYPAIAKKIIIGYTVLGNPITAVKISDNVADDTEPEAEMLYTGMHHAREGMSMMNLVFFMRYLLENYTSNTAIKEIVDNRELYFIPAVSFDGFNYNTTSTNWNAGRKMRRKNMTETTTGTEGSTGSGGDGVDINRNYGTYWGASYASDGADPERGSSDDGHLDTYRGASAFSEPETQAMRDFVNGRQFKLAFNYHCYGSLWISPSGPSGATYPSTKLSTADVNVYNSIAALFTKYNFYKYGAPWQVLYPVNGYSDDWMHSGSGHSKIYAFSPEVGTDNDGFWCLQSRIIPIAKELVFANLQAAYTAGAYTELQDNSDVEVLGNGSFSYTITRKGLTDGDVKVSIVPLLNIQTVGAPITIATSSLATFGSTYTGTMAYTLPTNLATGSVIKYKWQMEVGGITFSETITKIYKPTVVFTDKMETAADFANKWEKSSRQGDWAYSSGEGYSNSFSLTESPGTTYTYGDDQSVALKTALNLSSATNAFLSFLVKYQTRSGLDRLQIEISTSGVNGTYTPISTSNTVVETKESMAGKPALTGTTDGWVREIVDLGSYVGNANIGLRFRFLSSASDATYVAYSTGGFNIDNVQVVKTNVVTSLPIRFEDMIARKVGSHVLVQWKAAVDEDFHYYEIERSADGVDYESIALLTDKNATSYIDDKPLTGNNYYRIKAVEVTKAVRYSKTALVVIGSDFSITAFPNPVSSVLNIEINSLKSIRTIISLIGTDGRTVIREVMLLAAGKNVKQLNLEGLPDQLYTLKVVDEQGAFLKNIKIVKRKL